MSEKRPGALKLFKPRNIIIPVLISLAWVVWSVYASWDKEDRNNVDWNSHVFFWLGLTFLLLIVRMLAYMWRIYILSDKKLNLKSSFQIITIWEFASAITPSVIGGTAVAMFLLTKEKIKLGKSTSIVLITAFLDELFFILFAPILLLTVGIPNMFPDHSDLFEADELLSNIDDSHLKTSFLIGYLILLTYTILIGYGIFLKPNSVRKLLYKVFSIGFLKQWKRAAVRTGIDIVTTSQELKHKPKSYWIKSFVATVLAWLGRYLEANFVIIAFMGYGDQLIMFSRSFVMWIIMMIPTTPGASGIAEGAFIALFKDMIMDMEALIPFFWRAFSYFPYLIIGVIFLPRWIKRVYDVK